MLPMRSTITPKMKVNIKAGANEPSEIINMKTNSLARN